MTLRNRLITILSENGQRPTSTAARLADMVISELGLRLERGERSNPTGVSWAAGNRHTVTRYVTEWSRDE
jgi:hypothetical protein